jgi:E3 ubiquitin-protein ligase MGRN1
MPMGQVQQFFLEGMRPETGHVGNLARTMAQPQQQVQRTFTIRNDVNLKKNSLRLVPDVAKAGAFHLEFSFDAATDCRIRVFFASTEKVNGKDGTITFTPLKTSGEHPAETREKGLNQTFRTRDGHGLDTTLYSNSELTYTPTTAKAELVRFPIIVCLEAAGGGTSASGKEKSTVQSQTTFAALSPPDTNGHPRVQPLKQKIQVGTASYELQEIYGIDGSDRQSSSGGGGAAAADGGDDAENSRECVICMTEPRDTTVLPCRHMCMCSECAKVLRMQSEKCPICRTPIEQLLQIKISSQKEAEGAAAPSEGGAVANGASAGSSVGAADGAESVKA